MAPRNSDTLAQLHELFVCLSKLEHALISAGFFKKTAGRAEADWLRFCCKMGSELLNEIKNCEEMQVLWETPANQLCVCADFKLEWRPRGTPKHPLEPVLWVRHCVFHGESQSDSHRHFELRKAAIAAVKLIVDSCANLNGDLKVMSDKFRDLTLS